MAITQKVSIDVTDAAIINDAAASLLKIYVAREALKGDLSSGLSNAVELEQAITRVLSNIKGVIGQ